jgi:hypothetical protein
MKLNINSNTARLYKWFYSTVDMPDSLCPYFWKLALMWILILPYSICCLPVIIIEKFDLNQSYETDERLISGLILWFVMAMAICMLGAFLPIFFGIPEKDTIYMYMVFIGCVLWLISIIIGIHSGIEYLREKWRNRCYKKMHNGIDKKPKENQSNIIVEFVKASYNKYCPKIEWNNEK